MPAQKKSKSPPKKAEHRPIRREVGALVCFFFSIFTLFNLFGVNGWLVEVICGAARAVIGRGFWFLPFCLFAAAAILLFHRGRPVTARVICVLLVPVLLGAVFHLFEEPLEWNAELPVLLMQDGRDAYGGGLLGGILVLVLRPALSLPVTAILLLVGLCACVFIILRLSPVAIADAIRNRQRPAYEPEPAPEPAPLRRQTARGNEQVRTPPAEKQDKPKKRPDFDVPIYTGPDSEPEQSPPVGVLPKRGTKVKTPAEILQPEETPVPQDEAPPWEEPADFPIKDLAPPVIPDPPAPVTPVPVAPVEQPPIVTPVASVTIAADAHPLEMTEESTEPYRYPPVTLLTATRPGKAPDAAEELKSNAERLLAGMQSFGIGASIVNVTRGPSVTRYEIEPESGVKLATLTSRADDIALALGAVGVNIAPVPGKANVVGIEVPNRLVSTVYIRDLIDSPEFAAMSTPTSFVLGRDIGGQNIVADIAKLTHLLIAGTTGSGKSVCMNTLITSMLYKASPEELRFIMVDPKMVELGVYNGIPHLLSPVVTEPKRAAEALEWAVTEMDNRYNLLMQRGKRDIISYNEEVSREADGVPMPRIVIIIDEMADLMMVAHKEVETAVARIAQKARACGVHLILATQRPEAKVVTGIIKANTPSRIAFAVKGNLDSRIILDTGGAEKLVGRGDMLYLPIGAPKPLRVQGCYVSDDEVTRVVEYISAGGTSNYSAEMLSHLDKGSGSGGNGGSSIGNDSTEGADPMLPAAIEAIIESGQGSTSYLQRRLKLGYARAARLMDEMEERGIVGPFEGSKPRQVLITSDQWDEMKGS